jgi:UDP-N-acetyl-D-mannosaminuronic acid transferase (WecB/TagA/CpsF family)
MRVNILGIGFLSTKLDDIIESILEGGLVVVPSAPCLVTDLTENPDYRAAVTKADIAVADSGAMVLCWRLISRQPIVRISGLRLLEKLLSISELKSAGKIFWIHPSCEQKATNECWLKRHGFRIETTESYVAPIYPAQNLIDNELFSLLKVSRPRVVVIGIGGGVQERLGYWLVNQYRSDGLKPPSIVCTGAAIGFLSGNQVGIPKWADRLYLGWLFRCLSRPGTFIPRYLRAVPLAWLIFRYRESLPPLKLPM